MSLEKCCFFAIIIFFIIGCAWNYNWEAFYWFRLNIERTNDLLYNEDYISSYISQSSTILSSKGYKKMKYSNITFIGVARDVSVGLSHVLHQIEETGKLFASSRCIIIEGDSSDNTLHILQSWVKMDNSTRTMFTHSSLGVKDMSMTHKNLVMPREGRLAIARNLALTYLHSLPPYEYVIVIDMDVKAWDMDGIADTFGRQEWDVMCAHGVYLHGLYRDTYAFRAPGVNTCHHQADEHYNLGAYRETVRATYKAAKKKVHYMADSSTEMWDRRIGGKPLLRVDSCFGGMAIYRYNILKGCQYHHHHKGPKLLLDCEHVLLHECITSQNHGKIFSNPAMKLWFGSNSWKLKPGMIANHFGISAKWMPSGV